MVPDVDAVLHLVIVDVGYLTVPPLERRHRVLVEVQVLDTVVPLLPVRRRDGRAENRRGELGAERLGRMLLPDPLAERNPNDSIL